MYWKWEYPDDSDGTYHSFLVVTLRELHSPAVVEVRQAMTRRMSRLMNDINLACF